MKNTKIIFMILLLLCLSMGIPSATFSEEEAPAATFSEEETPDNIKTVYLKNGGSLRCEMVWVDGDVMYIQMRSGMMQFPLKSVDVKKTYKEAERRNQESAEKR
jgi:hypothetical protein